MNHGPPLPRPTPRSRIVLLGTACLLVAAGLATRGPYASGIVATYGGDTLWATLVFVLVLFMRPALSARNAGLIALGLSVTVELSQLLQWPALVALRTTRLGGLVLGHGFLCSDLICYGVGVGVGCLVDWGVLPRRGAQTNPGSQ